MRDFFRYQTELPAGSGFEMFGSIHVIWLLIIAVFSGVMAYIYRKNYSNDRSNINSSIKINKGRNNNHFNEYYEGKTEKLSTANISGNRIRLVIGIAMPMISIYRDVVLMITGHYDRFYLPLHLCGMALWIGALYCFTRWRFVGVVYVLLCVPGALSALIFPDWTAYPLWNYMHVHDFISHGLIVAWGICLMASGEIIPEWREIWMPIGFGMAGIVIIYPINTVLETNYWFLSYPSPGSPLVMINEYLGSRWYPVGYIGFVFAVVVIWLGIIRLSRCCISRIKSVHVG